TLTFLAERSRDLAKSQRELSWRTEEKTREIHDTELELGRVQGAGSVKLYDVIVELESRGRTALELDTFVSGTGWQPFYDLRVPADRSKVELTYRARIRQQSGEDWNDVAVALSTAQPQKGAQGPEPEAVWIGIWQPPAPTAPAAAAPEERAAA